MRLIKIGIGSVDPTVGAVRSTLPSVRSAGNPVTLAHANTVGAQDGLVIDGGGYVLQNGRPMPEAPRFRQGWAACSLDLDRERALQLPVAQSNEWNDDPA